MKRTVVIEHSQKEVRQGVEQRRRRERGTEGRSHGRLKKGERVWTLNRSPHGNKTAREQFGRQRWQRTREGLEEARVKRVRREYQGNLKRKERWVNLT
jgi:ribosomal protein S10